MGHLQQAIDILHASLLTDPLTAAEKLTVHKALALLAGIHAGRESDQQNALGGNPAAMNAIQRALGGGVG
jgi:hypothetical protein